MSLGESLVRCWDNSNDRNHVMSSCHVTTVELGYDPRKLNRFVVTSEHSAPGPVWHRQELVSEVANRRIQGCPLQSFCRS